MTSAAHASPVAVAVSGGADSLYSLILLRERGLDVLALHGIFFHARTKDEEEQKALMRLRLAERCEALGLPLFVVDLSEAFLQHVIRPFVQSYAQGRTPNPCALCNARIKFGLLQDAAFARGAGSLATGHYARLVPAKGALPGQWPALVQGADSLKDQSYFLGLIPGERLAKALFPLGDTSKREVLENLARRGITPPQPGESREICFVPHDEYREYVPAMAEQLGIPLPGPGPMLLRNGQRMGTHKGLWRYTEGQRRGLGAGWKEPLYVIGKEKDENILRLGARHEMTAAGCSCTDVNILLPPEFWPEQVLVKTRYRETPKPAVATIREQRQQGTRTLHIRFEEPDSAVAPGQVAAVYVPQEEGTQGGIRLVAGGVIDRVSDG